MALYPNEARNERTGHKEGSSKGKQGGHGTGKVKCSADGGKSADPKFKPASEVLGAEVVGDLEAPVSSVVKGASAVPFGGLLKGNPGKPMGGAGGLRKPKDAEDAGR